MSNQDVIQRSESLPCLLPRVLPLTRPYLAFSTSSLCSRFLPAAHVSIRRILLFISFCRKTIPSGCYNNGTEWYHLLKCSVSFKIANISEGTLEMILLLLHFWIHALVDNERPERWSPISLFVRRFVFVPSDICLFAVLPSGCHFFLLLGQIKSQARIYKRIKHSLPHTHRRITRLCAHNHMHLRLKRLLWWNPGSTDVSRHTKKHDPG